MLKLLALIHIKALPQLLLSKTKGNLTVVYGQIGFQSFWNTHLHRVHGLFLLFLVLFLLSSPCKSFLNHTDLPAILCPHDIYYFSVFSSPLPSCLTHTPKRKQLTYLLLRLRCLWSQWDFYFKPPK